MGPFEQSISLFQGLCLVTAHEPLGTNHIQSLATCIGLGEEHGMEGGSKEPSQDYGN
jgi:hypothetical protein